MQTGVSGGYGRGVIEKNGCGKMVVGDKGRWRRVRIEHGGALHMVDDEQGKSEGSPGLKGQSFFHAKSPHLEGCGLYITSRRVTTALTTLEI